MRPLCRAVRGRRSATCDAGGAAILDGLPGANRPSRCRGGIAAACAAPSGRPHAGRARPGPGAVTPIQAPPRRGSHAKRGARLHARGAPPRARRRRARAGTGARAPPAPCARPERGPRRHRGHTGARAHDRRARIASSSRASTTRSPRANRRGRVGTALAPAGRAPVGRPSRAHARYVSSGPPSKARSGSR